MTKDFTDRHREAFSKIEGYINQNLSQKRLTHTEGVRKTAVILAKRWGENEEKADFAALCHDMCKEMPLDDIKYYVALFNLAKIYENNRNLAHGKLAAALMAKEFDIDDEDVLNAVSYHTTGRANMSLLEKIIYIADAIEPGRSYPGVDQLRALALEDINQACYLSLARTVDLVKAKGQFLDSDTILAKEYFDESGLI